jgi:hypothetical protein
MSMSPQIWKHQLNDAFLCLRFLVDLAWQLDHDISRRENRGACGSLWSKSEQVLDSMGSNWVVVRLDCGHGAKGSIGCSKRK